MTAITKTSVKAHFETGDRPTQAQFIDLVDSYQNFSSALGAVASAAVTGVGIVEMLSPQSAQISTPLGVVGRAVVSAATTATLTNLMNIGAVGATLVSAATTAAAQQRLGGGTVGRTLFETATTAAAQNIIGTTVTAGAGTFGVLRIEATAAVSAVAFGNDSAITPANFRTHPGAIKARVCVTVAGGTPSIQSSEGVLSLSDNGTGNFNVNFSFPFSHNTMSTVVMVRGGSAFAVLVTAGVSSTQFIIVGVDGGAVDQGFEVIVAGPV